MRRGPALVLATVVYASLMPASGMAAASCEPPSGGYGVKAERYVPFHNRFDQTIAVDLYLPTDASGAALTSAGCRFPVVLQVSPYRDWITPQPTKSATGMDETSRTWWVSRGYVFAFADVPGTGGSDGQWCLFCLHEQLSGVDMVEALGREPWSNGRVGLIGGSYPAIEAMLIAQHRPPHLGAVIAAQFLSDPYEDFFFVGGMRRLEDATVLEAAYTGLSRWTGEYAGDPRAVQVWQERESAPPPSFLQIQDEHPYRDAWYRERTVHPERIDVPVYLVGGWNDMFDRAVWETYDRLGSQTKFLLQGPFTHVTVYAPPKAWPCESQGTDYCGAPVFDRFLKGVDGPAYEELKANPVRFYLQPSAGYTSGPAQPPTQPWRMALGQQGTAAVLHYDPAAGATSGRWFTRGSVPGAAPPFDYYLGVDGPADQGAEEQAELSFGSPILEQALTVVGAGELVLRVRSDAADADVVARIVDEFPSSSTFPAGYRYLVTSGWLRASHRTGDAPGAVRPLPAGRWTTLVVPIWPTGYRFDAGHRIRVDLAPADTPRFAPLTTPFDLTIDLGNSEVVLPAA